MVLARERSSLIKEPAAMDADRSERLLVAQAKLGDPVAISALYRRYVDRVYDFVYRRVESREAAEDATQTVFLKAMASLRGYREQCAFAGWLFAIAHNVVTDHQRAQRHRLHRSLDAGIELVDRAALPEEQALRTEQARELDDARRRCLSPDDGDLLELRLQGLTDREIATALGRSHGAIRTAQYRLIERLRKCLGIGTPREEGRHAS